MDQFIVSARKYRPTTFDSVVGQSHIAETLKNAIKSGHLAQAFLFGGPRGVGKTTCARILAKTINCFNRTENIEACEECESCKSFNEGHSLNIYELDAASNNSVDDIRALIDQVRFAPQLGSKKVYIIDEVHMLSTSAFNAFLKTLEEPPSHAMFILATTEKHKIIPTILSRCQIFDFNRIDLDDMVRKLMDIAEKEKVTVDKDTLHLISRKSDGSLRDALSMFDQMVTYSGNDLSYEAVVENLGILGTDYFFTLVDYLVKGDIPSSLNLFNEILHKGFDGHNFILGLGEHLRNLLVAQDHGTIELLSAGPQLKEKYLAQTLEVSGAYIIKGLNLVNKADLNYKISKNQRLLVELCLINLANLKSENEKGSTSIIEEPKIKPVEISNSPVEKKEAVADKQPSPAPPPVTSQEQLKQEEKSEIPEQVKPEPFPEKVIEPEIKEEISAEKEETIEEITVAPTSEQDNTKETTKEKADIISVDKEFKKENEVVASAERKKSLHDELVNDSISISSFTSKEEESAEEEENGDRVIKYTDAIDKEKLSASWEHLAKDYDKKGRFNLYSTLTKYEPILVDETHIEITYDNKAQAQAINQEKTNILEFLRKELRNDLLQLKLTISDKVHQRAYTASEKLDKMIENNPNIDLLKNKLDLDIN